MSIQALRDDQGNIIKGDTSEPLHEFLRLLKDLNVNGNSRREMINKARQKANGVNLDNIKLLSIAKELKSFVYEKNMIHHPIDKSNLRAYLSGSYIPSEEHIHQIALDYGLSGGAMQKLQEAGRDYIDHCQDKHEQQNRLAAPKVAPEPKSRQLQDDLSPGRKRIAETLNKLLEDFRCTKGIGYRVYHVTEVPKNVVTVAVTPSRFCEYKDLKDSTHFFSGKFSRPKNNENQLSNVLAALKADEKSQKAVLADFKEAITEKKPESFANKVQPSAARISSKGRAD